MRFSKCSWALCASILVAGAAQADREDEPFGGLDDSPRFMLYVHKELGAARHNSVGPSFGFAVDRPIPLTLQRDQLALRVPSARIFDLRVAPFDDGAIMLNGLKLTGGAPQGFGYSGSYGEGESWSWDNPWLWVGLALGGALGISCATDNWPCDSGGYGGDGYQVPTG
ncbi:MAG: hypothetical protein ACREXP_14010 [Steroidobacteraceae bacterium]